jgi:mannosyltransferase OCH1-like enzyme
MRLPASIFISLGLALCFIKLLSSFSNIFYTNKQLIISKNIVKTNVINQSNVHIPRIIIQTGGRHHDNTHSSQSFKRLNPNYEYLYYDDAQAKKFVHKHMSPEVIQTYDMMRKGVLKADYFRYIALYILGGVYSDLDTECLRPIDTWTDNHTNVDFIVGVEGEGIPMKGGLARQLQLCQWTFASRPKHPILKRMIDKIGEQTKKFQSSPLSVPLIMNWTGPGLWTDIIFDYFNETYHVEWPTLVKLQHGRLIGDVYLVPVAGFSPSAYGLGAKGREDARALVWHFFRGTWKSGLPD